MLRKNAQSILFFVSTFYVLTLLAENIDHEKLLSLAKAGNNSAQYNLGVQYYNGKNIEKDLIEAFAWFSVAAQNGDKRFISAFEKVADLLSEEEKTKAIIRGEELKKLYGRNVTAMEEPYCKIELISARLAKRSARSMDKMKKNRNMPGLVGMEGIIDRFGRVRDPIVVHSEPKGLYDNHSIKMFFLHTYRPPTVNNKVMDVFGVSYQISHGFRGVYNEPYKFKSKQEARDKQKLNEQNQVKGQYIHSYPFAYSVSNKSGGAHSVELKDWHLHSIQEQSSAERYAIGKKFFYGYQGIVDYSKAVEWLTASAENGYPYAQTFLARVLYQNDEGDQHTDKVLFWLDKAASNGHDQAKIFLAWILVTHKNEEVRDLEKARRLIGSVEEYYDEARLYETQAAVFAAGDDFKSAVKTQKDAVKWGKKLDWNVSDMTDRLASYQAGKPWRE